jgi:hypothetical protein
MIFASRKLIFVDYTGRMLYKEVVTSIGLGTPDNQVLIDFDGKGREPLGLRQTNCFYDWLTIYRLQTQSQSVVY